MSRRNTYFIAPTVVYNPDAEAWFAVANVIDGQKQAYSDFFDEWQGYGLWNKTYQILPLLLADATKNTKDMKLAFNSINYGGITHAATGVTGDGVSGYIDMVINPLNDLPQDNVGVTFCSNTEAASSTIIDAGAYENFVTYFWMTVRTNFDTFVVNINDNGGSPNTATNTNGTGLNTFMRTDSATKKIYKNGVLVDTLLTASIPAVNLSLNLMRLNPFANYSTREYNMWIVHESFDATEVANAHTAISNLKTALGL